MSKGAAGLVAGYWPDDVYRYVATPGLSLDEALVAKPAKRRGREPAIITPSGILTYEALEGEIDKAMRAILALVGDRASRVAVAIRDPLKALVVFLGALRARSGVLLTDPAVPCDALARQLRDFEAELLVVQEADEAARSVGSERGVRCVTAEELLQPSGHRPKTMPKLALKAPAIAMTADGGHLVYHSHSSLLSGALSWATFLALADHELLLCASPLHSWEGLYSVLPALFRGSASVLAPAEDVEQFLALAGKHRPTYTMLPLERAMSLAADGAIVRGVKQSLGGIFVTVDRAFRVDVRQKLQRLLGRPVMTVYGRPEFGPALASHPSWYLDRAVGIPVTNVDVWPFDPGTGHRLAVPWEAIEYAELGVRSPMSAVEHRALETSDVVIQEGWWRTRLVAMMDPSGFFYFL